MNSNRANKPNQ
jgi:hypothetical protein